MGLNAIALGLIALVALYHAYTLYANQDAPPPSPLPVPVQTHKSRSFHSQTRDAGLFTEGVRRRAIISNPTLTVGYKGSTNGSLEWNFLTGICTGCIRKVCPAPEYVADAGNAASDVCDIIDGSGEEILDFGDSSTNVCD